RAGNCVDPVAEIDPEVAEADAPADSLQPRRIGARRRPAALSLPPLEGAGVDRETVERSKSDTAGIEEADCLQTTPPPKLVVEIEQGERIASRLLEFLAVNRCADYHSVQPSVACGEIRTKRLVAVPETEVARVCQWRLALAAPGEQRLDVWLDTDSRVDLNAPAAVVVAKAPTRPNRGEARFERGDLPLVVGGGEVVQLAADVHLGLPEEWPLESERVTGALRRQLVRQVAGDKRVIEAIVIEDGDPHAERRREAVDGR